VIAASKLDAAHLFDSKPTPLRTVVERQLLQGDHTVRDAMQLQIAFLGRKIIEQKNRTLAPSKEVLQRENLPAITQ
jgi:hypothetical protein